MARAVKTVAGLERSIAAEEKALKELQARRGKLASELDALAAQLAELGGGAGAVAGEML